MLFLAVLCINIMLGMFVPYILVYAFIVQPIQKKKRDNEPQLRKRKKEQGSLKSIIGNIVIAVFVMGGILALGVLTWSLAMPHWKDIPSILLKQYEEKTGTVTDIEYDWERDSRKSWGFDHVKLDGKRFSFEGLELDYINIGDEVTVQYLKHSNYVIRITDQEGNVIKHTFSKLSFLITVFIYILLTAIYFYRKKRLKIINSAWSKRKVIVTISFHTITILILIVSCYFFQPQALLVVLVVHFLMHYIQADGGIRSKIV
ncbi:hypothetical protein [Paenibacillus endoradicis]|uniref:hypothetical protein n=1 Tax=Paenibacillus endoradicis TaxID=2972487 RepID=UPI002158D695|nr:hypothetical protein [Paenibacillus endoradicis]MCR8659749.1 hypothetical protein [Paenibacillus endoradicis]